MAEDKYRQLHTSKAEDVLGTTKNILSYIKKHYRWPFIFAIIFTLLSSLVGVVSSYLFTPILNECITPYIGQNNPDLSKLVNYLIILIVVYIVGIISSYAFSKLISIISTGVLHHMRIDLFSVMEKLPVNFFDTRTHGEVMNYYTNDIDTIRPMISSSLPTLIQTISTLVFCFSLMLASSVKLTGIVFIMLIIIIFVSLSLAKKSRKTFSGLQKEVSNLNGYSQEMFSGQKVIKVFNHEEESIEGFEFINERLYTYSVKSNSYGSMMMPINASLSYATYAIVAVFGGAMCIKGEIGIGDLASFLLYTRQFAGPISNISQQFNGIMMSLAGAERVFKIMNMSHEIDEGKVEQVRNEDNSWSWRNPDGKLIPLKGDIRLNNVSFSYVEGKPVLKNISLYAKPGQKIAFVGSTGAGKTTITNLLNRFYDVDDSEGIITYDGIPIKEIKKDDLRKSVGMVLQDTNLFSGTIMDNIRYGRLDATDEECIAAAKRCNASSFIERLPHGYQTMLSANGSNLSQGQRQLLNIARAAVADPPVMVLDEATSSIDTHTEKLIEKGMDELMKGRTTFVIAHRLSTVRNANAIIVLEHGEIVERGDHEDLLKQKGRYYQL